MSKPTLKERMQRLLVTVDGQGKSAKQAVVDEALSLLEEAREIAFRLTWAITESLEGTTVAALHKQGNELCARLDRALGEK